MRAMQLVQPGPIADGARLRLVDRPDPRPGPGELLLALRACAVCRTDLQIVEGDLAARRLPIVPGHQAVGVVVERASDVPQEAPAIGERVGVAWTGGCCGTCRHCVQGRENLCHDLRFTGWDLDGGYASHMVVRADFAHRLPEGFDDLAAAPLLCGGAIGYRSLGVAGVDLTAARGLRLGLYGFGASATIAIQLAVDAGCEVFVSTRSGVEQAAARSLGAAWTGGYDEVPPEPLDAAITFAPSGDVVVAALRALDRGGIVAINAIHLDRVPAFDYELLWMERQIRSVANVTRADVRQFLALAARIPIRTRTEVFPLDRAAEALRRLREGHIAGAAVLELAPA